MILYKSLCVLLLFCCANLLVAQNQPLLTFAVSSGDVARHHSPVTASLEGVLLPESANGYELAERTPEGTTPVACQLLPGTPTRLCWVLTGNTPSGKKRIYELRLAAAPVAPRGMTVKRDNGTLSVQQDGRDALRYQYGEATVPPGKTPLYRRGGFIHPLWSPKGEILTRVQPPDHTHHYGIWNPWTSTVFEGRKLDFWNLYKGEGTVRVSGLPTYSEGPVAAALAARHEHIDLTAPHPDGFKAALEEDWRVQVWHSGAPDAPRVVDFQSIMHTATDSIFTIKAYTYQGFGFRATEKWDDNTARLLTSGGKGKADANGTRAHWIDARGVSAFGRSGALFMTHPHNHNFPEQLRIWTVGVNQGRENVFLNFNPAQEQDWALHPGRTYALRYRIIVYDGELSPEQMEGYWQDYAHPPQVEIVLNATGPAPKVLVYSKNGKGYVHENIPYAVAALQELGRAHGFSVDTTTNPARITDENLRQYQAIILCNTNNETFDTDAQKLAFQRYIQAGGGLAAIHSCTGSERQWPWFWRTLGAKFRYHPPLQRFNIRVLDRYHPSTLHLSETWSWEDECYYMDQLNPANRVLLAADLTGIQDDNPKKPDYPGSVFGRSFPLCWTQEREPGRTWYTALGHKKEYYSDPAFRQHLLGGIRWVLDGSRTLDYSKAGNALIVD